MPRAAVLEGVEALRSISSTAARRAARGQGESRRSKHHNGQETRSDDLASKQVRKLELPVHGAPSGDHHSALSQIVLLPLHCCEAAP